MAEAPQQAKREAALADVAVDAAPAPTASRETSAAFSDAAKRQVAPSPSARSAAPAANSSTAIQPLVPLLAALASEPEATRWQANGGEAQVITPARQSWLLLFNQSAGLRWVLGSPPAKDDEGQPLNVHITTVRGVTRITLTGNADTLQRGDASIAASWVASTPQAAGALRQTGAHLLRRLIHPPWCCRCTPQRMAEAG